MRRLSFGRCWLVAGGGFAGPGGHGARHQGAAAVSGPKGAELAPPSLYERDLYQAQLRDHTNECSGMRFNVQWKTKGQPAAPLKLRVELRGLPTATFPSNWC